MMMWLPSLQSWATWQQAIRKFLLPIRVTPSSFSLPRLIVTPSRIVLSSPMHDLRVAAGVADVLRLAADHDVGIDHVVAADRDAAHDRDGIHHPRAGENPHMGPNRRERPDLDVVVDLGLRID